MDYIISSGIISSGINLQSGESMTVLEGGTANNTFVEHLGELTISSGGVANATAVYSGGLFVSGGTANIVSARVASLYVCSQGIINDIVFEGYYNNLYVFSGGTVNSASIHGWGSMCVLSGGTANSTTVTSAYAFISSGGTAVFFSVQSNGSSFVLSGGTANNAIINNGGAFAVSSGGTATDVTVNGGWMTASDGTLNGATVNSGYAGVSGGTVTGIIINGGSLHIAGSPVTGTIVNGGSMFISNATAVDTVVNDSGRVFCYNTTVTGTTLKGGYMYISGGAADSMTVEGSASVDLSDCTATGITVNKGGRVNLVNNGTAADLTVESEGFLSTSSGGKLTGRMSFAEGALVYATADAYIDFDLSGGAPEAEALVNNISAIQGAPNYTLTVSGTQAYGTFILAGGAGAFDSSITIQNALKEQIGLLTLNVPTVDANNSYRLKIENDVLMLTIQERDKVAPTVSNIQVNTSDPTNQPVTITAEFEDNNNELKKTLYRIGETGEWTAYMDGITIYHNTTVSFKAVDLDDNESETVSFTVANIGGLSGLVLLAGVSVSVLAEETFSGTVVSSGGVLHVSAGGTAEDTTVHSGGVLHVSAGGTAKDTTVHSGGVVNVISGGTAAWIVENGGQVNVENGANAVFNANSFSMPVLANAFATVHSGTTAGGIAIGSGGILQIFSSGSANDISVDCGGILRVSSGGIATEIVENGGYVSFDDAADIVLKANAFSGLVISGASATVHSGTTAHATTLAGNGVLFISSGGIANDTTVNSLGKLHVSAGGKLSGATAKTGGSLFLSSGGIATEIVENGGYVNILDGATAVFKPNTISAFELKDNATIHSGTIAELVSVRKGGTIEVFSGGSVNTANLSDKGSLFLFSGGSANDVTLETNGSLIVSPDGIVNSTTVHSGGTLTLSSGGTANEIVENGGYVNILDGATAVFKPNVISSLSPKGTATIHSGTTAKQATARNSGVIEVFSGGVLDKAAVSSGGTLHIFSGGTALNVTWRPWENGQLDVDTGAVVTFDSRNVSGVFIVSYGYYQPNMSSMTISGRGITYGTQMYVMSGGVASSIPVISFGGLNVYSGGLANSVSIRNGGSMTVSLGGVVSRVTIATGEDSPYYITGTVIRVGGGGMVVDTVLYNGQIHVSAGGTVIGTIVEKGDGANENKDGGLFLSSGGTAIGTVLSENSFAGLQVKSGCVAVSTLLGNSTSMSVYSGGMADNTIVGFSGFTSSAKVSMFLYGGTANQTTISSGGSVFVSSGLVNSVTVKSGGVLNFQQEGKLTGRVVCSSGGKITGKYTVDFDLTNVLPGAVARFNDLSLIKGSDYTITVNADQTKGAYALAEDVASFARTITVVNTAEEILGVLSVGETIIVSDRVFTLSRSDGVLTLKVGETPVPPPYTSNGIVVDGSSLSVQPGEVFYDIMVNSGGLLTVSSGGTALEIRENGGYTDVRDGATVTFASNMLFGLVLDNTSTTVHSGTTAVSTTVLSGGSLRVFSGGSARDIVWTPCEGQVRIDAGASASFASMYSGVYYGSDGRLISSAATMGSIELGPSKEMYVMSGGTANGIKVSDGGSLHISSGGTAADLVWKPCEGHVEIEDGAFVTFSRENYSGVYYGSDGQLVSSAATMINATLGAGCDMCVMSGGIASSTTVNGDGSLRVGFSGLANSVTISKGGSMLVESGAFAILPVVSSGGRMTVLSGGTAAGIVLHDAMLVSSAGLLAAITVSSAGEMVLDAGSANYIVVSSGGSLRVNGGQANSVTVFAEAAMTICDNAAADSIAVDFNGFLYVSSGGTATNVVLTSGAYLGLAVGSDTFITGAHYYEDTVEDTSFDIRGGIVSGFMVKTGYLEIGPGVTASDITVGSEGILRISSGGKLSGKIVCGKNGLISASDGAVIEFKPVPWATACITDLSAIHGAPAYTLTLDTGLPEAVYTLAEGAASFDQAISIANTAGEELGTLSVGETITVSDVDYMLGLSDDMLFLRVGNPVSPVSSYNDYVLKNLDRLYVSAGEVANNTLVDSCTLNGYTGLQVFSGGLANNTKVVDHGCMYISSGGTAYNTTLEEGSFLSLEFGAVVNHTTIKANGGMVYVSNGVEANDTVIASNGYLRVMSGGQANGVKVGSSGNLFVSAGGTATDITVDSGAHLLLIMDDETFVKCGSGDSLFEIRDGYGSGFALESSTLNITSGGVLVNASVGSESIVVVRPGGKLTGRVTIEGEGIVSAIQDSIIDFDISTIEPGTEALFNDLSRIKSTISPSKRSNPYYTITISDQQKSGVYTLGANASSITISEVLNPQGETYGKFSNGMIVNGTHRLNLSLSNKTMTLTVQAIDKIAPTVSNIQVSASNSTDDAVVVTADFADNLDQLKSTLYKIGGNGEWTDYAGGITLHNNATVFFKAIDQDGNVSEIVGYTVANIKDPAGAVVSDGESLVVLDGETFSDITVLTGGEFSVSPGGIANGVTVLGGCVTISSGGTATDIVWTPFEGHVYVEDGGQALFAGGHSGVYYGANDLLLNNAATMDSVMIGDFEEMYVMSGGEANAAAVGSGGFLGVFSGGVANGAAVSAFGSMTVHSGGIANSATVNADGVLCISSGGVADGATVNADGVLRVLSDGVATGTEVVNGGGLYVSRGGTADRTTVTSEGTVLVFSGGVATGTILDEGGVLFISSGGVANGITLNAYGSLTVFSGGVANGTTLNAYGSLSVFSGGVANGATVDSAGVLTVSSGGIASSIALNSSGTLRISSGGVANDITLNAGGRLHISSGGVATNIVWTPCEGLIYTDYGAIVTFAGEYSGIYYGSNGQLLSSAAAMDSVVIGVFEEMYVMSGGIAGDLTVGNCGKLSVSSGGTAAGITLDNNGILHVFSGGTATNILIDGLSEMIVSSGGVATGVTVTSEGYLMVLSGGTATDVVWTPCNGYLCLENGGHVTFASEYSGVYCGSNGQLLSSASEMESISLHLYSEFNEMCVMSGGIATGISLNNEGSLRVFSGGTATEATVDAGGSLTVFSGGTATEATVDADGSLTVFSGGTANNATVNDSGELTVSSGGTATGTAINEFGCFFVGGAAADTTVNSNGEFSLLSGGTATNTTVNSDGGLYVLSGGTATGIKLNTDGVLIVSSGGTATNVVWTPGKGLINVEDGGYATFSNSGVHYGSAGQQLSSATVTESMTLYTGSMFIFSGGTANNATVNAGRMYIYYGGIAKNAMVNQNTNLYISSGGIASNIRIDLKGRVYVCSGGTAHGATLCGSMYISNGGMTNNVKVISNGILAVSSGGTANNTTIVSSGRLTVLRGGTADNTSVKTGEFVISSGGTANDTTVNSGGTFRLFAETVASCTTVRVAGRMIIFSGGTADGITVSSGGSILVNAGARLTGQMTLINGAAVSVQNNAILDFDISGLAPEAAARVNDFSRILGTAVYTLTVSDSQACGTYTLAGNAADFTGTISVRSQAGAELGILGLRNTLAVGKTVYSLNLTGPTLSLTVGTSTERASDAAPQTQIWEKTGENTQYIVEYSTDDFEHVIRLTVDSNSIDSFRIPAGSYQWRVKPGSDGEWSIGESVVATEVGKDPKFIKSDADGNADVFFVNAIGTWEAVYLAQHVGSIDDWAGTNEYAALFGKNKLADIIEGSSDANVLLMTDDNNGDALFVDDIYTALPGSVTDQQSRIAQIDEIRAGAGDDIVDMTSQRFKYIGDGLTIRGGEGNDTIWANKGDNMLFGDAGNDRIVGASGNDVLAGGIGNDRMHGGGGNDIFTFCDNWGIDTVEQLAGGSVTLWFASELEGKVEWDEESKSYTDGTNRVTVTGVTSVELKFGGVGDDAAMFATLSEAGAFKEFTSQKIFEEKGNGMLASL